MERYHHSSENKEREQFISQNIVVKIGSSTITGGKEMLDTNFMADIARQVSSLFFSGIRVAIVTSGAVACGKKFIDRYDGSILHKQLAAAVGQPLLIAEWNRQLNEHGLFAYQLLLTEHNLPAAVEVLTAMTDGIPVINANDPVNRYEMRQLSVSADNDKLAAFVAASIGADTTFFLTDVEGVRDINGATLSHIDPDLKYEDYITFSGLSATGTGGMASKHHQALQLAAMGSRAIIANGREPDILLKGARGSLVGTTYTREIMK